MIEDILAQMLRELGWTILINATLVVGVAAALTHKLKNASADARYTIWGAVFLMLVLLPLVSYTVPEWTLMRIDGRSVGAPAFSDDAIDTIERSASYRIGQVSVGDREVAGRMAGPLNAGSSGAIQTRSPHTGIAWSGVVVIILLASWFVVAAALLCRFFIQMVKVGRITGSAVCVSNACGGKLAGDISHLVASLGIRCRVRVMLSEDVSMPFAWGVRRPTIILPVDAVEWPEDRILSVLTHELAHVARRDYLMHVVIELVRALYWPNPAVWFAARKSVMERERACDDYTLRSGTSYVDYAAHLLHIAKMQLEGNMPVAAVTMAGEPGLTERISHVMNREMNRSPLRKGAYLIATALVVLIALPLGTMAVKKNSWRIPTTKGLIEELNDSRSPGERSMAAWWLGEHETEKAVDALLDGLNDDARIVRVTSGWALGEIKDRDSIDGLIETLETDDDLLVREMAALALGEIEHHSAIDALEAAYRSDERLAPAVVWALGEIARRDGDKADDVRDEIIDDLGERTWRNEQVWTGTLKRKRPKYDNAKDLIGDLGDGDADVRCEAAFGLGRVGREQGFEDMDEVEAAVSALIKTLEDPVPEVRAMAVWSLDEINPSRKKITLGFLKKK
jgi:HEAT repeat protein/beta-lactamase regulating signal transducer with metallopeptidase domain